MKTTLIISLAAVLYATATTSLPVYSQNRDLPGIQPNSVDQDTRCMQQIGSGVIKEKNGNSFTIESDDGQEYQAEYSTSYKVGDVVLHSDPVNGWVEIIGRAD